MVRLFSGRSGLPGFISSAYITRRKGVLPSPTTSRMICENAGDNDVTSQMNAIGLHTSQYFIL